MSVAFAAAVTPVAAIVAPLTSNVPIAIASMIGILIVLGPVTKYESLITAIVETI